MYTKGMTDIDVQREKQTDTEGKDIERDTKIYGKRVNNMVILLAYIVRFISWLVS